MNEFQVCGSGFNPDGITRTYGIPTISKLLVQTKQLAEREYSAKRYVDTVILIAEFIENDPTSQRANAAIARMNYIHSVYQKKGLISNSDMLYTLSLFALEPSRWFARFEWRSLTDMELCAMGTFWKSVGDAMQISYDELPSSKKGWRDGLHWLEKIEEWSETYEAKYMVPDPYNKKTADETTNLLLWDVPETLKPYGRNAVSALLGKRLRNAMMYPPPPDSYLPVIEFVFKLRKYFLLHLALPRPDWLRANKVSVNPNKTGRYHFLKYENEPWYVEDSVWNRFSLKAWFKWLVGRPVPGPPFQPEGYHVQEIGPRSLAGKGGSDFEQTLNSLMAGGRGGCPFFASS